jgi:hypothetical protein
MAKYEYRINEGSEHERFINSRAKIRLFGGGFGNGKTALLCVTALRLAREYPGSNGLIARSTYPKLNDTIKKEFKKWCPASWIKSWPKNDNICELVNGTTINFRYIAQQGKSNEASTSNLLSATYDWAIIDQVEDPEIEYKDFLDILGRLRGSTPYVGSDTTMPMTGPRWFLMNCNPTRNWVYQKLVKPAQDYERTGLKTEDLIWDDENDRPMIEIFNAPTTENADNLPKDFISTMSAAYKGVMKKRFIEGDWGAYEGLVYPTYGQETHQLDTDQIEYVIDEIKQYRREPTWIEAYDWGKIVASCYGLFVIDTFSNVFLCDGFYKAEYDLDEQIEHIHRIRRRWYGSALQPGKFFADPAIFRGGAMKGGRLVGKAISQLIQDTPGSNIRMLRGNNHLTNGIIKVSAYMSMAENHRHPMTGAHPAPHFFHNSNLTWFTDEITNYMWKKKSGTDQYEDTPTDKNDHAMNMLKYAFTEQPRLPQIVHMPANDWRTQVMQWHEAPDEYGIEPRYA